MQSCQTKGSSESALVRGTMPKWRDRRSETICTNSDRGIKGPPIIRQRRSCFATGRACDQASVVSNIRLHCRGRTRVRAPRWIFIGKSFISLPVARALDAVHPSNRTALRVIMWGWRKQKKNCTGMSSGQKADDQHAKEDEL